jgi:hypothetical protein
MIKIIKQILMFLTAPMYSASTILLSCAATILAIDVSIWFSAYFLLLPLIDDKITDYGIIVLEEYIEEDERNLR